MPEEDKLTILANLLKLQNRLLATIDTKLKELLEQNSEILEQNSEMLMHLERISSDLAWYVRRLK